MDIKHTYGQRQEILVVHISIDPPYSN